MKKKEIVKHSNDITDGIISYRAYVSIYKFSNHFILNRVKE